MENLISNNIVPTQVEAEAEMSVEAFTNAVKAATVQLQAGINAVWVLGSKAVKMAYGGSPFAKQFCEVLLNELPADAARQTHDWLKKAGITVNRPLTGSKLYWLSSVTRKIGDADVEIVTAKKPGDDGFGYAKEKALLYVKTTPPMALERKDAKPRPATVVDKSVPVKNRAREVLVGAMKRAQKKDPEAAREINDLITMADDQMSCIYDAHGVRQKLADVEFKVANRAIEAMNNGVVDAETILKVLSGDYKVVLEERT